MWSCSLAVSRDDGFRRISELEAENFMLRQEMAIMSLVQHKLCDKIQYTEI